jgi:hypothetical protein
LEIKKKKKLQLDQLQVQDLLPPEEAAKFEATIKAQAAKEKEEQQQQQSTEYITDPKVEKLDRELTQKLRFEKTKSRERLTKTNKEIIREYAVRYEQEINYPVNQICDHLTKLLTAKKLVSDRTVREALDAKYKNPEQSQAALGQNHGGGSFYRQQEQVKEKDLKDIGLQDIKFLPMQKARQVAKEQMSKALYLEQQTKQDKVKIKELTEQNEDLKKQITFHKKAAKSFDELVRKLDLENMNYEEIGKVFKGALEQYRRGYKADQDQEQNKTK